MSCHVMSSSNGTHFECCKCSFCLSISTLSILHMYMIMHQQHHHHDRRGTFTCNRIHILALPCSIGADTWIYINKSPLPSSCSMSSTVMTHPTALSALSPAQRSRQVEQSFYHHLHRHVEHKEPSLEISRLPRASESQPSPEWMS